MDEHSTIKVLKAIAARGWRNGTLIKLVEAALSGKDVDEFIEPKILKQIEESETHPV